MNVSEDLQTPTDPASEADAQAILQLVHESTGMDFRDYAPASVRRRMQIAASEEGCGSMASLLARAREDRGVLTRLLQRLTLPVTAMFRDPSFYAAFRREVVPVLRTHPYLRLWVAGCSTGQEAYSLAILLHEEGLLDRARIYATDVQVASLDCAREGIYPIALMQTYTRNYHEAGGRGAFCDYYTADAHGAILRPFLKRHIVVGQHNLATDNSFNEFQVIFCRNVLIYFNAELQARAHRLFHDSLAMFGYLGLGRGETVRFSAVDSCYRSICVAERIYRRIA